MERAVHPSGLAGAGGGKSEREVRKTEPREHAREGEGAVDILRHLAVHPVVALILPAELQRVLPFRPDQSLLHGVDGVPCRVALVVSAAERHRKARQPADGDGREALGGEGVRVHSQQPHVAHHGIAREGIELVLGLAPGVQDAGVAHGELIAEAGGEGAGL